MEQLATPNFSTLLGYPKLRIRHENHEVKTSSFLMDVSWAYETLIANPMSIYPKFKRSVRAGMVGQSAMVVEIKTDDNITG